MDYRQKRIHHCVPGEGEDSVLTEVLATQAKSGTGLELLGLATDALYS